MPLLEFYTNPGQLTEKDKTELVEAFTSLYARIMPDFFVNIVFHELPKDSFFVGGKPTNSDFVRLKSDHIFRNWDSSEASQKQAKGYMDFVSKLFKEKFGPRGWRWENHVVQSSIDYWRVQGLTAPPFQSEAMEKWKRDGAASEWENKQTL